MFRSKHRFKNLEIVYFFSAIYIVSITVMYMQLYSLWILRIFVFWKIGLIAFTFYFVSESKWWLATSYRRIPFSLIFICLISIHPPAFPSITIVSLLLKRMSYNHGLYYIKKVKGFKGCHKNKKEILGIIQTDLNTAILKFEFSSWLSSNFSLNCSKQTPLLLLPQLK